VALLASAPLVLVVHPSVPADSFKAFVALARSKRGSSTTLERQRQLVPPRRGAVRFHDGVEMVHVPYKGLSPALTDLLSGRVS